MEKKNANNISVIQKQNSHKHQIYIYLWSSTTQNLNPTWRTSKGVLHWGKQSYKTVMVQDLPFEFAMYRNAKNSSGFLQVGNTVHSSIILYTLLHIFKKPYKLNMSFIYANSDNQVLNLPIKKEVQYH